MDSIDDRGCRHVHGQLTHALGTVWRAAERCLHEDGRDVRRIE